MKTLPVEISFCKPIGGKQRIMIEIMDGMSHCQILEVSVSYDKFTRALFNESHVRCEMAYSEKCPVGMKVETKCEVVKFPIHTYNSSYDRVVKEVLAPMEVDGWKARYSDAKNNHNGRFEDGYRILFTRYVEADQGEIDKMLERNDSPED